LTDVLVTGEQPPVLAPDGKPPPKTKDGGGPPAPPEVRVTNDLPGKLVVPGLDGRVLVLSPLETHTLPHGDCQAFAESLAQLEDRRCVTLETVTQPERLETGLVLFGIGIWATLGFLIAGAFYGGVLYWSIGLAAITILAIVIAWQLSRGKRTSREKGTLWLQRLFWPLLVVLVVGVTVPASSVYFGGGLHEAVDVITTSDQDELAYLTLIGRGLQALLISIASLLPALLYFLFDRLKVETLRSSFEQDIFRFDPTMRTRSDVRARYGTLMDELYGRSESTARRVHLPASAPAPQRVPDRPPLRSSRVLPGRLAPIWVATVVITSGWILSLLNPDVAAPLRGFQQVVLLFEPQRSPVVFAFLGAYVFALQSLLRSYLRSDLRPKSFMHITVRIIVAVVFAWVLELLFSSAAIPATATTSDGLLVLAFVVGILPETLLVRLQESVRHLVGKGFNWVPTLYEQYPLNKLEGIDIYDRSRLIEEGVGNIEGLAHHYLPELMMQTRIPVARLVYWTDQAILYLHVVCGTDSSASKKDGADPSDGEAHDNGGGESRLRILQAHGIQTATDLENAHAAAVERDRRARDGSNDGDVRGAGGSNRAEASEEAAFLSLLEDVELAGGRKLPRLLLILDSIADEEWMPNLRYWHDSCHRSRQTLTLANGVLVATRDPANPSAA
jgi:hypothetical protein